MDLVFEGCSKAICKSKMNLNYCLIIKKELELKLCKGLEFISSG